MQASGSAPLEHEVLRAGHKEDRDFGNEADKERDGAVKVALRHKDVQTGAEQHGPDAAEDVRRGKSEVTESKKAQAAVFAGSGTTSDNDGLLQRDGCGACKSGK